MMLPERYDPKIRELFWLAEWEKNNTYKFDSSTKKELFTIDTPPPTLSGMMHIGHSYSYSQTDFIARFQRMLGREVFYPFGTDDNGLPTERLVEKLKGVKSSEMSRADFVALCLKTLEELHPSFVGDWKRLGISCDFNVSYSTIDDHSRKISQRSFVELWNCGRCYRRESPAIWCPECQTAISQVELKDKILKSQFVNLKFRLENGKDILIATTRPEMLPACVGIFVHPDDSRYKNLVGKRARVPLFGHFVTIRADPRASMDKGTGIVMCCTFGDQTDIEWFKAHNLELKTAITRDGKMAEIAGAYTGLKIRAARKKIVEDLKSAGLVDGLRDIEHPVNVHERCDTEVEIIQSKQWFIKYLDLKEKFLEQGRKINWYPEYMRSRLENWINGLQWDWCISRQRHFGIPFPVWYCVKCDEPFVAGTKRLSVDPVETKCPVKKCSKCGGSKFIPEKDVLDTWATSSLTPRIAAELFEGKAVFKKLYPMTLRPQAHDIISFWLFNTLVKSFLHDNVLPWRDAMISGWLLAPTGEKMSKSKGNVISPQVLMAQYSADALRYLAASSKLGEDMPFQEKMLVTGAKTVTKIFNAMKFSVPNLEGYDGVKPSKFSIIDSWALSKLQRVIESSTESFLVYEYSKSLRDIDSYFWHIFCDNYLEIIKDRFYNKNNYSNDEIVSARFTLYYVTLNILKLYAPFLPFITEEAYHFFHFGRENAGSIHRTSWPAVNKNFFSRESDECGDVLVDILSAVRKFKSKRQVSLKAPVKELHIHCEDLHKELICKIEKDLKSSTFSEKIVFSKNVDTPCDRFAIEVGVVLGGAEEQ